MLTKYTEIISLVITAILAILKQTVLPDIPTEAFYTVIIYIITRAFEKGAAELAINKGNPVAITSGIKTSEGKLATIAAPVLAVISSFLPVPSILWKVIDAYIVSRGIVKVAAYKK